MAPSAIGHNPTVDGDPKRPEGGDEAAAEAPSGGGMSYTARPSRERPEEGGATRDEDAERADSPEGREQ